MQAIAYRKLSELVVGFSQKRTPNADAWVKQLFESLDWGHRPAFAIQKAETIGYRLLVDNAPVITVVAASPKNVDSVYRALNYSYNKDIPWVVATDFYSLGLFGSYWPSFPHDVSSALAIELDHTEYLADSYQLELLTPHSVAKAQVNELYDAFTGRKRRLPIDRHLVGRMEEWRRLILNAIDPKAENSDPLIHRLINTLFLIRYLEDTGKLRAPSLREIAGVSADSGFQRQLQTLFKEIKHRTRYNVPSKAELQNIQHQPLRILIGQLYGYPEFGIIYDFGAMNVDVLGKFYEEYLSQDVIPKKEQRPELGLFEADSYEFENARRQKGIYYTPPYIVDFILNSVVERFKSHSPRRLPVIADIAAGSGTFLTSSADHLLKHYPKTGESVADLAKYLVGFDVDERAVEAARLNLTAKLIGEGSTEPLPPLLLQQADIIKDGIDQVAIQKILPDGADIVVGNPPYIPYETLRNRYNISGISELYETAVGRTDSYIIFVEAALRLLRDGGFGGLVVPNSILRTQAAGRLREWLTAHADLLEIVDFAEQSVFSGVGAYICLLIFRKRSTNMVARDVTVARLYTLSDTPASQLASISVSERAPEGSEVFRVNQPLGRGAWNLRNKTEVELLNRLKESSDDNFSDVLSIRQGVKTGADEVFIVEASRLDTELYVLHGSSQSFKLEKSLLVPVVRNRDLKRWGSRANSFLIYPYDRETHRLLSWEEIEQRYQGIADYLRAHFTKLSKRRSLRGKQWYELVEPRLASVLSNEPKLVSAEIGLRTKISRTEPENATVVGNAWLTQLNVEYDLDILMAFLNSSVAEWYLRQISPLLHGGYLLLRQNNFSKLPLPRFLKTPEEFAGSELKKLSSQLKKKVFDASNPHHPLLLQDVNKTEEQIDSLVMEALDFRVAEAEQVRKSNGLARRAAAGGK